MAGVVPDPEVELRIGVTLFGGQPKPARRFGIVLRHARAIAPYMFPSMNCALDVRPCSAASRYQRTASASSSRTPRPLAYMFPRLNCAVASPCSAACRTVSRSSCAESTMTARPPATITAVAVRISLGILLIGFKCGLLSLMSLAPHFPFHGPMGTG